MVLSVLNLHWIIKGNDLEFPNISIPPSPINFFELFIVYEVLTALELIPLFFNNSIILNSKLSPFCFDDNNCFVN